MTSCWPPLDTMAPVATPKDDTVCTPPLEMVVVLAVPP